MTIVLQILREAEKGGDPDRVDHSETRRGRDTQLVDDVIALDWDWVKAEINTEQKRKEFGQVQKGITDRKKDNKTEKCSKVSLEQKAKLEAEAREFEKTSEAIMLKTDSQLNKISHLLPTPGSTAFDFTFSKTEDDNAVVSTWGVPRSFEGTKYGTNGFRSGLKCLHMIGAVEFDSGRDVPGERAYFLTSMGVLLKQALLNYGIAFLSMKGYTSVQPPFFLKEDPMAKTAKLDECDETLYKLVEEFWQSLGVPYRTTAIVSGDFNNASAKQYALEGFFPSDNAGKGKYRELVSWSNCHDYKAGAMQTKYGFRPEDFFRHMLDRTEAGMSCLVENYQEADGIRVPAVLQPFMFGASLMFFTWEYMVDTDCCVQSGVIDVD